MANYHVVRNDDGNWGLRREGASRVSGFLDTQRDAEQEAKRLSAKSGGGKVRIHGLGGKIRDGDTVPPATDPCPPKDKKN